MLAPKNTLVALAGQNAWHICTGEAVLRISGKYRPSQLRTQNEGPELATVGRGAVAAGCGSVAIGSAKKLACGKAWRSCCFWAPPKKKSNRLSADALCGASAAGTASAATTNQAQRRMREW